MSWGVALKVVQTFGNGSLTLCCYHCAERKAKMRQAQQEAKKEIEEYKASREAKLRAVQPEVLQW
jgi:hypothetical protein